MWKGEESTVLLRPALRSTASPQAVLVEDGSGRTQDVARSLMTASVEEGTVLTVPVTEEGAPDWSLAVPDEELRQRRLSESRDILEQLKRRDPGGDVVL